MAGLRRAHRKSRKGCKECKRRKVKCDELRPACFNCTRYGVSCSYGGEETELNSMWSPPKENAFEFLTHRPLPSTHSAVSPDFTVPGQSWTRDIELMHHYCTHTSNTMSQHDAARHVWRVVFPQEGYEHDYVLHGVLSLAALHRAYLAPDKRDMYLTQASYHYSTGQNTFAALLGDVTDANWRPIYCFALIVIGYVLCLPVQHGPGSQSGSTALPRMLELISVTKGINAILSPFIPKVNSTNLAPIAASVMLLAIDPGPDAMPCPQYSLLPSDTLHALSNLRRFFAGNEACKDKEDYEKAVSALEVSAVQIARADVNVEVGAALIWPFYVPDSVIQGFKEMNPNGLLILAYYSVLLDALDRLYWFWRGWAWKLLDEIDRQIENLDDPDPYQKLLAWPQRHIKR